MKPREEKDGEGEGKLLRTDGMGGGATGGTGSGGGGLLPGQVKDVEEALVETAKEVRVLCFLVWRRLVNVSSPCAPLV